MGDWAIRVTGGQKQSWVIMGVPTQVQVVSPKPGEVIQAVLEQIPCSTTCRDFQATLRSEAAASLPKSYSRLADRDPMGTAITKLLPRICWSYIPHLNKPGSEVTVSS
jgi:hypothetical protein